MKQCKVNVICCSISVDCINEEPVDPQFVNIEHDTDTLFINDPSRVEETSQIFQNSDSEYELDIKEELIPDDLVSMC